MIDNFDVIADILRRKTVTDDNFFFLQIIRRRKENPEMTSNNKTVDVFYVKDVDDLLARKDRVIKRCTDDNARAYINLNRLSKRKVALHTMKILAECIYNENYNVAAIYTNACGTVQSDKEKTWVIDVDFTPEQSYEDRQAFVGELEREISALIVESGRVPTIYQIPTKNGLHLITQPFNLAKFSKTHTLDCHKNNPTILFIP